jgi:hypothetical protein
MAVFTLQDYFDTTGVRIVDTSQGTLTNSDILNFLNEELRRTKREVDIENTRYVTQLDMMYGVFQYPLPEGYDDFAAITYQGQINDPLDFVRYNSEEMFWRNFVNRNSFCEQRNGKYRTCLINFISPQMGMSVLDNCDAFDENGTWVASTDTANLRTFSPYPQNEAAAVTFDIIPSQSGSNNATITKTDLPVIDLSGNGYTKSSPITMEVYLPDITFTYTSFTLKWGSSAANYYSSTVTEQADGTPFVAGKNFLRFDWVEAAKTPTGTPDDSSITYLQFSVNFPSTMTATQYAVRVKNITARQVFTADLHYYSGDLVIDGTTGEPKEQFDDTDDTESYFSCDFEFIDILTYGILETVFTYYKIDPKAAAFNKERREKAVEAYMVKFPSQRVIPVVDSAENPPLVNRGWWDEDQPQYTRW